MVPYFGLARQYSNIKDELLDATHNVLSSGTLIDGPYASQIKEWLKIRTGAKYAVLLHSGTQALYIIAKHRTNELSKLDANSHYKPDIVLPNLTYPATLNAFISAGWKVTLGDTDNKGLLNHTALENNIFVCQVGLYGKRPDYPFEYGEYSVIIDGAQHWLECGGEVGSGMAISFDPTKNISASGNGGAIVTNDLSLCIFASQYRNNGKENAKDPHFSIVGTNSKMSELDCAHLAVRSRHIDEWQMHRKEIAQYYIDRLQNLPIRILNDTENHAQQKFVIYTAERDRLRHNLMTDGIETKIHYEYVLNELPIARHLNISGPDFLSTSKMLSMGVLSLPIYPELLDSEVEYIVECVRKNCA